jgi:heme A synthase
MKTRRNPLFISLGVLVFLFALAAPASQAWAGEQYQTVPTAPPGEAGELPTLEVGELPTATPQYTNPAERREPNLLVVGIVIGVLLLVVLASFISWLRWRKEEREF